MAFLLSQHINNVHQQQHKLNRIQQQELRTKTAAKQACINLVSSPQGIISAFTLGVVREVAKEEDLQLKKSALKRMIFTGITHIF